MSVRTKTKGRNIDMKEMYKEEEEEKEEENEEE